MTHVDKELEQLKLEISNMWELVIRQLEKTRSALISFDKSLAQEVVNDEKNVNDFELKLDRECESIFAIYNPVAIDLRFVLAVLKINTNLERTGDIAEGIAKFILHADRAFDPQLLARTEIIKMFDEGIGITKDAYSAFRMEDTGLARSIFARDEILDEINGRANSVIADHIRSNADHLEQGLYILSIIRKMERVGDQCKNIAEEIIFYIDAKVLKHSKKGPTEDPGSDS